MRRRRFRGCCRSRKNHGFSFCKGVARRAELDPRVLTPSIYGPLKLTLNE
jgi:hypothetical protein